MRPVHLSLSAFGPFPMTEEIHFDKLGKNPLFLINGATGSGKTSLLDAICFALYGKSTGDEREASQMRCDLAEPGTLTEVALTFELAGKTYRIHRIPEQLRPKARGEGFTTQPVKAEFYELLDNGEERLIVSGKVTEATSEIETLTGLNADQFRQVMVLPQGKFRQLLMAESKDREQIFSKLFQTQHYKKLEDSLKSQANEIRREVEKQRQINQGILDAADLESSEALAAELTVLSPQWEQTRKAKLTKEKNFLEASNQLQKARSLFDRFSQLQATRQQQQELTTHKPEFEQKRQQLWKAELAGKLSPLHKEMARCKNELILLTQKLQQTEKDKLTTRKNLDFAEQKLRDMDSLSLQLDQLKQDLVKLNSYLERSAKLAKVQQALAEAEKSEKEAEKLLRQTDEKLRRVSQEREQSEKELEELQQNQLQFTDKKLEFKELSEHLATRAELENNRKKLAQQQDRLSQAELAGKKLAEAHAKTESMVKNLELKWHQGQAALLAKELKPGQPCPVCGSLEHPSPTKGSDSVPTELELEQARIRREQSQESLASARDTYIQIKSEVSGALNIVNASVEKMGQLGTRSIEELLEQRKSLENLVDSLVKQQTQIKKLIATIATHKKEETAARKTLEEAQKQATEKKSLLASIEAQVEGAKQELPPEYRETGELDRKIKDKRQDLKKLEKEIETIRKSHQDCMGKWKAADASHQAATESQRTAKKLLEDAVSNWETALNHSVFETETAYLSSLLKEEVLRLLKQEIDEFDLKVNHLKGALDQQESALKDQKQPDLELLEEALQKVEAEKSEVEEEWQLLDKRLSQLQATQKKLKKADSDREKLEKRYALIGTLSDVANGQTGNKVSLQRFVLSVLLDDVLIEASHRLRLMSKGRYQLLRKEDKAKGNRASGLDLEVEDAYSGKVRPVATLSGGESFMAALSMALGLSDVVQAYAGGIKLDTLFIDEGFGSLDPEALELAIRTLVDLQSSGRMIGIISHVSDLREQLTTRLDVISGRKGSQIRLITPWS
ncbi:SMC family ATPase [bacterium]|nr:SMC family ATPase [bacterium]